MTPRSSAWVRRWLKAGVVTADGLSRSVISGTPQGGVISPLLANVYLHRLDQEMRQAGVPFLRHADDLFFSGQPRRKRGMSLEAIIGSLNPVIRGWGNYFVEGHVAELFEDLDKWIRMRIRSYVLGRPSMRTHINRWMTTATLHDKLGLVSLVALRRRHLSPAPG